MLEDGRAVTLEVLVRGYAIASVSEEISQHALAVLERLPAEVVAVKLDEIEGAEHSDIVVIVMSA